LCWSSLRNTSRWSIDALTSRTLTWQSPHSPRRQSNIMSAPQASSASSIDTSCGTVVSSPSRGMRTGNGLGANRPLLPNVSNRSSAGAARPRPRRLDGVEHRRGPAHVQLSTPTGTDATSSSTSEPAALVVDPQIHPVAVLGRQLVDERHQPSGSGPVDEAGSPPHEALRALPIATSAVMPIPPGRQHVAGPAVVQREVLQRLGDLHLLAAAQLVDERRPRPGSAGPAAPPE
jgi:hypothetical protein